MNPAITVLAAELRSLLGDDAVSTADDMLDRSSVDGSRLSPIISEQLPLGRAELVVLPGDADGIAIAVAAAVRHQVPITPRGKGTGNYGQGIPMHGGLVVDTSRARTIHAVDSGAITADAGATFVELERAAAGIGQQILMYPSTARSTIGGFLSGGSGGTGSIKHGMLHTGYALALDVVHATPDAELVHVEGSDAELYLHNYGTAGIIARADGRARAAAAVARDVRQLRSLRGRPQRHPPVRRSRAHPAPRVRRPARARRRTPGRSRSSRRAQQPARDPRRGVTGRCPRASSRRPAAASRTFATGSARSCG